MTDLPDYDYDSPIVPVAGMCIGREVGWQLAARYKAALVQIVNFLLAGEP
jgi:hypothetical protein